MYFYPDKNDAVINAIIARSPYKEYWEMSENYAFRAFERLFKRRPRGVLLDLGCGEGRLLARFHGYYEQAVALDGDRARVDRARINLKSLSIDNVQFVAEMFLDADFGENIFDVVICSHVIQHIATNDCSNFLTKLQQIIKPGGLLLLSTNHASGGSQYFTKAGLSGKEAFEVGIREDEFNHLITNNNNILPVHYFPQGMIQKGLSMMGFCDKKVYHCLNLPNWIDKVVFRDVAANMPLIRNYMGRDIMITALKN